jgi:hypothetical protein
MFIDKQKLNNNITKDKIGSLYADINLTKKTNLLYYFMFMIRRLIFAITAIYSSEYSII